MPSAAERQRRTLRVLELIDDASVGGGQKHVLMLARGLKRRGCDVHVACAPEGYLVDELRRASVPVHPVTIRNRLSCDSLSGLVRLLRAGQYDVLHTHGGTAGFWGRAAALRVGGPATVHTYHGLHSVRRRGGVGRTVFRAIDRLLARRTDHVICVSHADFAAARAHGLLSPRGSSVVTNGIEMPKRRRTAVRGSGRSGLGLRGTDLVIGSIGRLESVKGFECLLDAFADVLRRIPDSMLVIVGDGPLRSSLEARARRLVIDHRVRFTGARYDIDALLETMDIFVLSSLWEGLPLAVLEAFSSGVPVIASATAGASEVVMHGMTGLLVPVGDSAGLAAEMLRLARDARLRSALARRARAEVARRYSAAAMVESTHRVYQSLVP